MNNELEAFKTIVIAYATRYAVDLPDVLDQAKYRLPALPDSERRRATRDLLVGMIDEGLITLLRDGSGNETFHYGEASAARLNTDEAWVSVDLPQDYVVTTPRGAELADAMPEEIWLEWEYPAG